MHKVTDVSPPIAMSGTFYQTVAIKIPNSADAVEHSFFTRGEKLDGCGLSAGTQCHVILWYTMSCYPQRSTPRL
eukprot:COSAG01_NODE_555_length_15533_cov_35.243310_6_plen_74_part_00